MEAGIAILLLVIILIVAVVAGVIFAGGLGALTTRRRKLRGDAELTGDGGDGADRSPGAAASGTNEDLDEASPTHTPARNDEQDVVFHGAEPEQ
jgi:hypothetical protein